MKVTNLSSGSDGNCTFVSSGEYKILVDIGINYKLLKTLLSQINEDCEGINAILITHEHFDHICGLECFLKKHPNVIICANQQVWEQVKYRLFKNKIDFNLNNIIFIDYNKTVNVGAFNVQAIENMHDSVSCCSFVIDCGGGKLGISTDLGLVTRQHIDALSECKVVYLECNHDLEMLNASKYPYMLKQRIKGTHGHLSNSQCAAAAVEIVKNKTKVIVLSHISKNSNIPEVAYSEVANALGDDLNKITLLLTYPKRISKTISIL